ncbi:MAG TPA: adenosylcobinamide-GDP ribazoletransferase [Candidatus Binataceae bacterium]|nr:adenosylcobinamide-GDP ribazoletransferase [Candidatus Binataceae bacterium]
MDGEHQASELSPRAIVREMVLCAATLTLWPILKDDARGTPDDRMRALELAPVIGFAAGVVLAALDRVLAPLLSPGARSVAVLAIAFAAMLGLPSRGIADTAEALRNGARVGPTGLSRIGPLGAAVAIAAFALEAIVLARTTDPAARASAIVMSQMLGRFAIVPVAYGLRPLERWGLGLPYEVAVTFREFGVASVIALGLTTVLYQNIGLIVVVAFAIAVLLMRLVFSRRLGGVAGYTLGGASAIAELAVLATVAALVR